MSTEEKQLVTVKTQITSQEFEENKQNLIDFVSSQLREAKDIQKGDTGDYGVIPYTKKKSLLKPGAEKLLKLFGFTATMELVKEVEDFENRFVYYKYKCTITHAASGTYIANAIRSCNSKEKKHAGKDVYDAANTIEAIAQKRALVAATIQATMASDIFEAADNDSDFDKTPPKREVTKAEDPKRIRLMGELFRVGDERGFNENSLHAAAKKKFGVESFKDLSNEQVEELTELLIIHYRDLEPGETKPVLRKEPKKEGYYGEAEGVEVLKENLVAEYKCQGKKHEGQDFETIPTVPVGEWCSDECRDSIYPPKSGKSYPWEKKDKAQDEVS